MVPRGSSTAVLLVVTHSSSNNDMQSWRRDIRNGFSTAQARRVLAVVVLLKKEALQAATPGPDV